MIQLDFNAFESLLVSSSHSYTHLGITQAVTSEKDGFGNKIYTKRNLTKQQIDNYLLAEKLGIGIKIIETNIYQGFIKMRGGISLKQYLDGIYKQFKQCKEGEMPIDMSYLPSICKKLQQIEQILKKNKIAHCDIKPHNLVYIRNNGYDCQLYLIDSDDMMPFGQLRRVGTPTWNCQIQKLRKGQKVTEYTDSRGFILMRSVLSFITKKSLEKLNKNSCQLI